MRITGEYAAILPVARYDTQGEPARQAEMGAKFAKLVAGGSVRVEGDMATAPAWVAGVHDLVAPRTA